MLEGPRYNPAHFWGLISSAYGGVPSKKTRNRMLRQAEVTRDADGCYGSQELAWLLELVNDYLAVGKTYRHFRRDKGLEGSSGKGFDPTINVDYEVT